MILLNFEKIYSTDRINEPCYIGIPLKKGLLKDIKKVSIKDEGLNPVPSQIKSTGFWDDGSIKWIFARFFANIKGNKSAAYYMDINSEEYVYESKLSYCNNILKNSKITLDFYNNNVISCFYDDTELANIEYHLKDKKGNSYNYKNHKFTIKEEGKLCIVLKAEGYYCLNDKEIYKNETEITIYKDKPYFEIAPRLINTSYEPLEIESYSLKIKANLKDDIKAMAAESNYKTKYNRGDNAYVYVDANKLKYEANEHNPEVFYGTFFGDICNEDYGICATVYQAQQNFPKAISVDNKGIEVMLVPKDMGDVVLQSGMARQQKVDIYFHKGVEAPEFINNHSTIYQMPDRPLVAPEVFKEAGIFPDVFVKNKNSDIEIFLTGIADEHSRCYGILNWGDSPDIGYTEQGRGDGKLVWTNNEYDFPHAAALQYIRTGIRRYLDYVLVTARHWLDVDICHYSDDPLIFRGMYEHTRQHIVNGKIICSHQWVEGLLDYYHFTGDSDALEAALGIGRVIENILETPIFKIPGETNAREAGWALRSLTALYLETNDKSWLKKCDSIVEHFKAWENKYGLWLSPYTDNTAIRVVFMISVAIGSLMRYYRINKNKEIKEMILRAIDDLCENAVLDCGLFYYKELPSLKRLGNNPLILEALAIAYELTGNLKYIEIGIPTFKYVMNYKMPRLNMKKQIVEDTLMFGNAGTKSFAQMMIPFTLFYKAAAENNLLK